MTGDDQLKFIELYDQLSNKIFQHLYFRVNDREKAKELMQETFMKTWLYLQKGKEVENLKAFIYRVATNLAIDESKKKKSVSLEEIMEEGFSPSQDDTENIKSQMDQKEILEIIDQLPPKYKEILIMRYVDELSISEMAEILGKSENHISVKIHRSLHQLKTILNKNDYV